MPEFIAETYVSRGDVEKVALGAERARVAAACLARQGRSIRYVRSIFISDEETCLYIFEATRASDVSDAARLAELEIDWVVEAVSAEAKA